MQMKVQINRIVAAGISRIKNGFSNLSKTADDFKSVFDLGRNDAFYIAAIAIIFSLFRIAIYYYTVVIRVHLDSYLFIKLAQNLFNDNLSPIRFAPLYPLELDFLATVFDEDMWVALRIIQTFRTLIVIIFLYLIIKFLFKSSFAAFIGSLMMSFHPELIGFESWIATENMAVFLFYLSIIIAIYYVNTNNNTKKLLVLFGICLGLLSLCRPLFQVLLVVGLLLAVDRASLKNSIKKAFSFLAGYFCIVSPWMLRNKIFFGKFAIALGTALAMMTYVQFFLDNVPERYEEDAAILLSYNDMMLSPNTSAIYVHWEQLKEIHGFTDLEMYDYINEMNIQIILRNPIRYFSKANNSFWRWLSCGADATDFEEYMVYKGEINKEGALFKFIDNILRHFHKNSGAYARNLYIPMLIGLLFIFLTASKKICFTLAVMLMMIAAPMSANLFISEIVSARYRLPYDPFIFSLGMATLVALPEKAIRRFIIEWKSAEKDERN